MHADESISLPCRARKHFCINILKIQHNISIALQVFAHQSTRVAFSVPGIPFLCFLISGN